MASVKRCERRRRRIVAITARQLGLLFKNVMKIIQVTKSPNHRVTLFALFASLNYSGLHRQISQMVNQSCAIGGMIASSYFVLRVICDVCI